MNKQPLAYSSYLRKDSSTNRAPDRNTKSFLPGSQEDMDIEMEIQRAHSYKTCVMTDEERLREFKERMEYEL
jgi:hypothetical protein